ncbi:MAG: hypothetical protein WDN72_09610 [Alphaproteobacteria bacterium]
MLLRVHAGEAEQVVDAGEQRGAGGVDVVNVLRVGGMLERGPNVPERIMSAKP